MLNLDSSLQIEVKGFQDDHLTINLKNHNIKTCLSEKPPSYHGSPGPNIEDDENLVTSEIEWDKNNELDCEQVVLSPADKKKNHSTRLLLKE